ncbi:MAG: aminotransferase class IV [Fusobacteria bacterium]|nr:aminotransferase class IV [Fusobacteriota bacterium]
MKNKDKKIIYYNDKFILNNEKKNKGFLYGQGCIEEIKITNNKLNLIDIHIEKLEKNMKSLDIYRKIDFYSIINEYTNLKDTENNEYIINIVVNDTELYISLDDTREYENYNKNTYDIKIIESVYHNELSNYNTINRLTDLLAKKEIIKEQLDDGIYINREKNITNTIYGNVFFIKKGIINTPKNTLNILNSVSTECVKEIINSLGYKIQYGEYKLDDLIDSDGIFITNIFRKNTINIVRKLNNIEKNNSENIIEIIKKEYLKKYENML